MAQFTKMFGKLFASTIFTIGFLFSQGTCCGLYYQADMPDEMIKKFE